MTKSDSLSACESGEEILDTFLGYICGSAQNLTPEDLQIIRSMAEDFRNSDEAKFQRLVEFSAGRGSEPSLSTFDVSQHGSELELEYRLLNEFLRQSLTVPRAPYTALFILCNFDALLLLRMAMRLNPQADFAISPFVYTMR